MLATPPEMQRDIDRLVRIFGRASVQVERDLAAALRDRDLATARNRRAKSREVKATLAELRRLAISGDPEKPGKSGRAWDLVRTSYRTGSDRAIASLETAGGLIVERSFAGIHQDAAEVLYEELSANLDDAISYAGRRVDEYFRRAALEETLQGVVEGRTRMQTSTAIADRLQERGIRAFRARNGAEWSLDSYAEMVARTSAREAHTRGTVNRLAENGLDLVKISSHEHKTDVCSPYEGRIFSISSDDARYPAATGNLPPYHPNCIHVATPYIERFN